MIDVYWAQRLAAAAIGSEACRLVPTKEDFARPRRDVAQRYQRLMQQRHGLGQVDDVDVVARAVDEGGHFGFQRWVRWPKWAPDSRSWRMVKSGNAMKYFSFSG